MVCMDKEQRTVRSAEHVFKYNVMLDDTEGYFVIGGGKYINGVEGYFGPVVYYRNQISPQSMSDVVIPDVVRAVNLTGWLQTCQEFRFEMNMKIDGYSLMGTESGGRGVSLPALGKALYSLSLHKLGRVHSPGVVRAILPLLHQAGCLADNRALYMLSVLYSTGLGVKKQPSKAWLLALLAAQKDDRLALLHLGTLHHQGLHGAPTDPDLAYGYYANIAQQTIVDRQKPTPQQTYVEAVFLNNDEILNLQTNEDHHIFQWLKLQARRGAAEAEQTLARMLFWGQQGVPTNIQRAVRHYERGAVQWEDPVSMYDYGIVLLQGHGVKKDIPKALTFLKKAKEKGFVPAINALAWYYEKFEQDYKQAVQLWEQADLLKCPEAAFNLGVMYSQGLYPGKAADQYMAYRYYLKSGERGHIKGAMLTAHIWTTGIPGHINRRPLDAVLWAKWAAEHNGYLGTVLRKALDSYLKSDMFSALFYYMMAAESGYAAAQFNVAYLCEQNAVSYRHRNFLDPAFATHCMWRYYNMTIQSQNPDTYALIRLGDLLYEGRGDGQKDLISAAEMYKLAALRNDPQGWYNLGLLAEEGYRLPLSILTELGLSELYLADNSLLLSALYKRCRDSGDTDSYVPCSLALFSVYLQLFQKDYGAAIKFSTAIAMVAAPTIFFGVLRRRVLSLV
uniref:protein sel-1 homolog 3 n=1 Tax=Monopterus albus TaxID=43700 RepID=UPI0009B4E7EB|nr:protein sel-1 homolog 3-like [Monopterus albus]